MAPSKPEIKILTPIGMLGYGYSKELFWQAVNQGVDAIIVDSGSTDSGPQKLALGETTCPLESYVRDLTPMLEACWKHRVPVLIGSCGGDGSNVHVDLFLKLIRDIAEENKWAFKTAAIYSDIEKAAVHDSVAKGLIRPCGPVPVLTAEEVDAASVIVAQMGHEPYLKVLQDHPDIDIIIGGRSYDPAPYAAFSYLHGIDPGVAYHMGKIMECGGLCATPKGSVIVATVREHDFDLEPVNPAERCTVNSVSAHTLYEKTRPDILPGPGGTLYLDASQYTQITPRKTRISGAKFVQDPYTIKLEGAKITGHRYIAIGGIRDPILIGQIDPFLERVKAYVFASRPDSATAQIIFHVYGKNGVMAELEPLRETAVSHELCIIVEVSAPTKALARALCNTARVALLHAAYPGQIATGGNFASPLTPLENYLGEVCGFNVYHLMPVDDALQHFPITVHQVGGAAAPRPVPPVLTLVQNESSSEEVGVESPPLVSHLSVARSAGKKTIPLRELAKGVRSKNAGPFEITLDVMFETLEDYEFFKQSGIITEDLICKAYQIEPSKICALVFYDQAMAFKVTLARARPQGSFGETDMHGCQQYAPLVNLELTL